MYIYIYIYNIPLNRKYPTGRKNPPSPLSVSSFDPRLCGAERGDIIYLGGTAFAPSPPAKSLDFRGFDSSRLLNPKGGNSHVR